jgi:hypothetical protein
MKGHEEATKEREEDTMALYRTSWQRKRRTLTRRLSRLESWDVASDQTTVALELVRELTSAKAGGEARDVKHAMVSRDTERGGG